ncbi:MAG: hypothetical protein D6725_01035 [Planctomycetota bacterium]|nr:MAG: hypothetical protein D6725_01035 [Planctomycetota bacterium]
MRRAADRIAGSRNAAGIERPTAPVERPAAEVDAGRPSSSHRRWTAAVCVSTVLHGILLAALACWSFTGGGSAREVHLSSRWAAAAELQPPLPERWTVDSSEGVGKSASRAGSSRAGVSVSVPDVRPNLAAAERRVAEVLAHRGSRWDWLEHVGPASPSLAASGDDLRGEVGPAHGAGDGDGTGIGFFGRRAAGRRFVYVLDCSKSMNHPYPGPAKTRFIRVKLELVKSLQPMGPEHEFFIVFFNQQPIPMPARSMQAATTGNKLRFLTWVHQVRAEGGTEPTEALRLALSLKPDAVFFLTDGSFQRRVQEEVAALPTGRTVIHTFAFHEELPAEWRRANELIDAGRLSEARRLLGTGKYRKLLEHRDARSLLRELAAKTGGGFFLIP